MRSENPKTGTMVQTWIFRSDQEPNAALQSGEDASVCGDCPLRPITAKGTGGPICYATCSGGRAGIVNVYRSWAMGNIPLVAVEEAARLLSDKQVRLGSYGDPAAVPLPVWDAILEGASGWIGYTHQWDRPANMAGYRRFCMASVETAL